MSFTNILFPVDFSERCRAVVPDVQAACDRFKAKLTLLHLVHIPAMAYGAPDAPVIFDLREDELKAGAEDTLLAFAESAFPGRRARLIVELGDPSSRIASFAKEWDIDLIMMPSHGRGRFRAALLGSVTASTLHDATCAVWINSHSEGPARQNADWSSIICAIDTDGDGSRLIREARDLAAVTNATVRLAHAVPSPQAAADLNTEYWRFAEFLKDEARRTIAQMQKEAGTNFQVCMEAGGIPQVIRHAAESHNADLVMIGRGVLPRFAGGLRSHVYPIVRHMPCPVLSV